MNKITSLVENSPGEHLSLISEHGLSFLIETKEASIRFDLGQSDAFISNAELLNCDLSKVKHIVISHGHYDHSGGLKSYIEKFGVDFTLWVSEDLFVPKYGYNGKAYEFLGNNFTLDYLQEKGVKIQYVKEDVTEILPNLFIVTNFGKYNDFEQLNSRFNIEKDGDMIVDDFHDEVMLVLKGKLGLVNIVGCSHPGILNMLETVRSNFSEDFYAILGGTHLVEANDERLAISMKEFKKYNFSKMGVSHCTGAKGMEMLKELEHSYYHNRTGSILITE